MTDKARGSGFFFKIKSKDDAPCSWVQIDDWTSPSDQDRQLASEAFRLKAATWLSALPIVSPAIAREGRQTCGMAGETSE
jgi:hypothetical protein